jgi:hypothetical protein
MNFENLSNTEKTPNNPEELTPDFPLYPKDYVYNPVTREGMADDDKQMFFNNQGELDKNITTKMWYAVANAARINHFNNLEVSDPKNIQISGFLKLNGINYDDCFDKSGAYRGMVLLPEDDIERQKLLDFQVDLVMHSFTPNLKEMMEEKPRIKEVAHNLTKAKIQYDADSLRNRRLGEKEENKELSDKLRDEYQKAKKEFEQMMDEEKIMF